MAQENITLRFQAALQDFLERVQKDQTVLAVILFGSLSYDTVWERSDIDLMVVTVEERSNKDRKTAKEHFCLIERDVHFHAHLFTRSAFKQIMEGSQRGGFFHSAFSRSQLVFCRDESLLELWRGMQNLGEKDRQSRLLTVASSILPALVKAEKFCRVRQDARYAFLWLALAYPGLAEIEVLLHSEIPSRETLPRALQLNPGFFKPVYADLVDAPKTLALVEEALLSIQNYLLERKHELFGPIFDYLAKVGEPRSCSQIEDWFEKHTSANCVIAACEWLADQGVLIKTSAPARITARSLNTIDELAFYYNPPS